MILRLTNNYNLKMPEGSDVVNIEDLNYNTNVIDNTLLQNKNDILNIIEVTNSMGSEIEVLKDKVSSLDDYVADNGVECVELTPLNGIYKTGSDLCRVVYSKSVAIVSAELRSDTSIVAGTTLVKLPKFLRFGYYSFSINGSDYKSHTGWVWEDGRITTLNTIPPGSLNFNVVVYL